MSGVAPLRSASLRDPNNKIFISGEESLFYSDVILKYSDGSKLTKDTSTYEVTKSLKTCNIKTPLCTFFCVFGYFLKLVVMGSNDSGIWY